MDHGLRDHNSDMVSLVEMVPNGLYMASFRFFDNCMLKTDKEDVPLMDTRLVPC